MENDINNLIDGFAGKEPVYEKKIGLYFGSFNPIHVGHLIIGNYIAETPEIDEVWYVVSPHNPHKNKANLLEDYHRLALVKAGVEANPKLAASDIEFGLPKPSYTAYTLQALKEKHPSYLFTLIMGEDNLNTLHKWKNFEHIIENYTIIVYPRVLREDEPTEASELLKAANISFCDAPVMNVSASFIRRMIKEQKDVQYLLTEPVFKYLDEMNFYK